MTLEKLVSALDSGAAVAVPAARGVTGGYTSDLLSDVMANAKSGDALITIQAHRNTVAVSSLVGIAAVVVCNAREIPPEMAQAARDEGIGIVTTGLSQFEVSGLLWSALRSE